jgi:hypothetical protein
MTDTILIPFGDYSGEKSAEFDAPAGSRAEIFVSNMTGIWQLGFKRDEYPEMVSMIGSGTQVITQLDGGHYHVRFTPIEGMSGPAQFAMMLHTREVV